MVSPIPEKISPNQSKIGHHLQNKVRVSGDLLTPLCYRIDQIYSGAVSVKMRQANRIAGAVNSN